MKKIIKWLDSNLEECILCVLLAVMTCVLFLQICLRTFTHNSLLWAEELARDCFIYSAFFCIPMCVRRNTMLKVDIIVASFPEKIRKYLIFAGDVITTALWLYLWYFAYNVLNTAIAAPTYSSTMGFNLAWIYGMPFVAFALAAFRGVQRLIRTGKEVFGSGAKEEKA